MRGPWRWPLRSGHLWSLPTSDVVKRKVDGVELRAVQLARLAWDFHSGSGRAVRRETRPCPTVLVPTNQTYGCVPESRSNGGIRAAGGAAFITTGALRCSTNGSITPTNAGRLGRSSGARTAVAPGRDPRRRGGKRQRGLARDPLSSATQATMKAASLSQSVRLL